MIFSFRFALVNTVVWSRVLYAVVALDLNWKSPEIAHTPYNASRLNGKATSGSERRVP